MEVDSDNQDTCLEVETDFFLGTLTTYCSAETNNEISTWEVTLHLNDKLVLFKIDTGADIILYQRQCSSNYKE